jgi:hypothetical protein
MRLPATSRIWYPRCIEDECHPSIASLWKPSATFDKNFKKDPLAEFIANFDRLAIDEKWSKNQEKRHRAESVEFDMARHWVPT